MKRRVHNLMLTLCVVIIFIMGMSIATASRSFDDRLRAEIKNYVPSVSALCKDGTYSTSKRDTGTCSGHGGVERWMK